MIKSLIAMVSAGATFVMFLFLAISFGTIVGAISGWIVGLFFGESIIYIFEQLGIVGMKMWQIGAFLGFVSGFFKNKPHKSIGF